MIDQLNAFLLEQGLVFAENPAKLRQYMPEMLSRLALLWSE